VNKLKLRLLVDLTELLDHLQVWEEELEEAEEEEST